MSRRLLRAAVLATACLAPACFSSWAQAQSLKSFKAVLTFVEHVKPNYALPCFGASAPRPAGRGARGSTSAPAPAAESESKSSGLPPPPAPAPLPATLPSLAMRARVPRLAAPSSLSVI